VKPTLVHTCTVLAVGLGLGASACDFTEFDSLANTTWAHATTKPSVSSSDWGIAMAPAAYSGSGGDLLVIGADPPTFANIEYTANGGTTLGPGAEDLNVETGQDAIPDQPILISDPSGASALVIAYENTSTLVWGGTDPTKSSVVATIGGDNAPGGATFFEGAGSALEIAVAGIGMKAGSTTSDNFHIVEFGQAPSSCPALLADGSALDAVALAFVPPPLGSNGAFLAWNADGRVVMYEAASAVATCSSTTANTTITAAQVAGTGSAWATGALDLGLGFAPVQGQIALVPNSGSGHQLAILAGHTAPAPGTDLGDVIVLDVTAGTIVGTPMSGLNSLRGFAFGELADNNTYVALGFPLLDVSATASAGQVQIFAFDTTTGISGAPVTEGGILSDAQPSDNELFGRSLAMTNFNGKQILVVGASNEIFSYYQTQIYGDTRN
jgi:hypothetical protein